MNWVGHEYTKIKDIFLEGILIWKPWLFLTYLGFKLDQFLPSTWVFLLMQPFIERITANLHCWTVRTLSFAGKVRLVSPVVYGMVNFWRSVFALLKSFYAKIDSLCSVFNGK